jgi:hypothetical protein
MSKKCNVICVVGPGFPFAHPTNIADLSENVGKVIFFSTAQIAFESVRDKKVPFTANAIIFTDDEAGKTTQHLHNLVQLCGWQAAINHVGDVFSVTTGGISQFVNGEKIHTVDGFIATLESWVETGRIPKATASI